jgi:alpha-glucan,water dikinase
MALIYVWLRLSTMKQLDWHRGSSYQSKDIAHAQKTIAQRMADKARAGSDPLARQFARMALAGLPRGGGDGDAIRMGILNVMRDNGIREGHRPVRGVLPFSLCSLPLPVWLKGIPTT